MNNLLIFESKLRVRFEETDAMGVVWHGNYARYLEVARFEWLCYILKDRYEHFGRAYTYMMKSLKIEYNYPAKFDDVLVINTIVKIVSKMNLTFFQKIYCNDIEIVSAESVLVCLDEEGTVQRVPKEIRDIINSSGANNS